ncbi:MAG: SpoIIE family protein phosphatase [Firmicutes bacterium]|nr:SpoIIE family protein phosphatase [Bacillota bacterium]
MHMIAASKTLHIDHTASIRQKTNAAKRFFCMSICVLLLMLLMPQFAFAEGSNNGIEILDPINQEDSYSAVIYNNTNGLPTSEANAIAQTSEGFIWIGSYSGLIRYDGNTFERVDSSTGISSVVSLFVDSKDRLWIGMNDSGLAMMDRGEFTFWDEDDGLGAGKVRGIAEGEDGIIYVATTAGINTISLDLSIDHIDDPRIADLYLEQMKLGSDGLLYCLTNEDDYFTVKDGELIDFIDHTEAKIQGITSILPDPDEPGKLYLGTESSDLYYGDIKKRKKTMEHVDLSPLFSVLGIEQVGDKIWIMANNGLGVVDKDGFHDLSFLPMNNSLGHVIADYEGNLWFTSTRQGVMKLVPNHFQNINERYGLPEAVVNSTCLFDGKLFIATDVGLQVLSEDRELVPVYLTEAKTASGESLEATELVEYLDGCRVRSIIRDSKDRLWFSTWRGEGLLRYDHGVLTAFTEADGLLSDHIRAVSEAEDGSILVAHTGGVAVIKDDEVIASYDKDDGILNPESLTVIGAPNGDILLCSNGGGIYVINDDGVRCVNAEDGLSSGIIMRIKYDEKRDIYWLVTSNSIAYMDPDYKVTTIKEFPYSNNFDLYENNNGEMWVISSDGIYVVPVEQLIENGEIRSVHYGLANGLPFTATSNSYSELTPDGDLYLSGNSGVVKVNIDETFEDISDIKQAVPYVEADGARIYPDKKGNFTIPASTLKLIVYAYIYNYSLTDPEVSYRLEGFDLEDVTVKRSELGPVIYTNLSGGTYKFIMELKDALGRETKTTTVTIEKEKALFEEPWFYIAVGLALITGIGLLIRNYIRWMLFDIEKKHKEEAERQRIGSELMMANKIQLGMLPHEFPPFPDRKEFDIYASADPAREVGGDFYDFYLIDEDHLCVVMADVSGKGIPAALFMMISKVLLKSFANLGQSASEILTKANDSLCADNRMDMFVTVWLGILEISTGRLVAANAGHEYPALKRADGFFETIKDKHGLVIGGMEGILYKEYEIVLSPGDKLFLYTDGVPEATDSHKNMFGMDRMLKALDSEMDASPKRVIENVQKAVDEFVKDAEQFDDMTMLCLEYFGKEGSV